MKPLTFYVDETYGPGLVGLLQGISLHAVTYRDADDISAGDPDVAWIPTVARREWIAVSSDKRLRSRRAERQAIQNARLRLLVIAARNATEEDTASIINKHRRSILALVHYMPPPFISSLTGQKLEFEWLGPADELARPATTACPTSPRR